MHYMVVTLVHHGPAWTQCAKCSVATSQSSLEKFVWYLVQNLVLSHTSVEEFNGNAVLLNYRQ